MARFVVKATALVDVEISVEAPTQQEAVERVSNHLILSASLVETPDADYDVYEDSITGVERMSAVAEHSNV